VFGVGGIVCFAANPAILRAMPELDVREPRLYPTQGNKALADELSDLALGVVQGETRD
jgi:hypothetical protein